MSDDFCLTHGADRMGFDRGPAAYCKTCEDENMAESSIVKALRDQAARATLQADNPFEARKHTVEWRAADYIEHLERAQGTSR